MKKVSRPTAIHESAGFASHEKCKAQEMKKESLNECCYGNQLTNDTLSPKNRSQHYSSTSDSRMLEPVKSTERHEAVWALSNRSSIDNTTSSQYSQSLEKLFLGLESVRLSTEDEDSASDLSDSERVPIPPSPLTPPKLNLRAEEINPGYFSQHVKYGCEDYEYSDFLPPPYNSWNLHQVSMFLNKEGKNTLQSTASAPLERYVDRLLQLEWLQMQTVQSEKAKKSRPQTVPATCRNGKSPGKCKPWQSPLPTKLLSGLDSVPKTNNGQDKNSHKKYAHRELCGAMCLRKSCSTVSGTGEILPSAPKQTHDVKCKKKTVTNCQQTKAMLLADSKMLCAGNIRPERQISILSNTESLPKQTKGSKIRKSALSVNSQVTNRHCIAEQKK
ncbi:protein FAM217B [Bufo gargarizans]|uniref:protein FAM217B n=1 Tax=Bufo gargarizans TaxID=30331 RepID=UPI001CF254E1|nr:protein FAM217B [Bufo gargarizans]XP_044152840.1 protein FAM217B [Bufo gargarizans]XP_044152841.1 protein FAM217B [Bufo gargarizans]